jgi:DNA-directed RNA polymerase III subunit RPC3
VRLGKVTKLVEDRFGNKAANVMTNLLRLGHTRIADLKEAYFPTDTDSDDDSDDGIVNGTGTKRKRGSGAETNGSAKLNGVTNGTGDVKPVVNGNHAQPATNGTEQEEAQNDDGEIASVDELYEIIEKLIQRGWVRTMTEVQYLSPGDMHDMLQQETIDQDMAGQQPTGVKDKDKAHRATLERKRHMRDKWLEVPRFSKRRQPDQDYSNPTKRVKVNGANGYSNASGASPEDKLVIRVNPEKIAVAMRTEQLVQLVEQRLGHVTAHIYQTMLRMLEENTPRCYEEYPEPPVAGDEGGENQIDPKNLVTAREVAKKINRDLDICEGLDPNAIVQITRRGHVRSANVLSQPTDPSTLSIDEKTRVIDKHIQLLSEDPTHFVTWHSRAGFSQWHIEFEEIAKQLIQTEIENTISARKGTLGVKLVRALRKKGKLDERATCNAMMMSAADIRGIVNDLTVQGLVQTQEIPKVERREAKHSLHLIWYDRQRAREKLLHDTYKGMVRILQRIHFEREKVQPLLSKAERSDVVGNEEKWLSKGELDALRKWKEVQEKLSLQLFREDDLVATLRDFHGPLVSV